MLFSSVSFQILPLIKEEYKPSKYYDFIIKNMILGCLLPKLNLFIATIP